MLEVQPQSFVYIPLHWFSKQERLCYIRPAGCLFAQHDERPFRDLAQLLCSGKQMILDNKLSSRENFALLFSRFLKFAGHVEWNDVAVGGMEMRSPHALSIARTERSKHSERKKARATLKRMQK
jgi:hypothetical protein